MTKREAHVRGQATTLARLRLAAIVESSDDAIIGKDVDGIITDWNNGAERLYGYSTDEVIGKSISLLLPSDGSDDFEEIMRRIRGGEVVTHFETIRQKKDGSRVEVSLTISPIRDRKGRILGASTIARDITDRKRTHEALHEKDMELSEVEHLAGVGSWRWNVPNDVVTWSEELYRIAGLDPTLPAPSFNEHPSLVTAESWERLQRAVEVALRNGTPYELDLELVRPDGTTRWVRDRGEAVNDTPGHIIRLHGTLQDVTERKQTEEALASMTRKLLEAQELERKRIARELHDNTTQRLALLAIAIEQLKNAIPDQTAEVRRRMVQIHEQTLEISKEVQGLSHELHSSQLEYLGLVSAMKGFGNEFGDRYKVEVVFVSEGVPATLPPEVSLCLFRVMQEGLHNALKHSGMKVFEVKLHGSPGEIRLTVRDSGVGFDSELHGGTQGLGLVSMRERVRLVNGTLSITSRPESGTEISVGVPVTGEPAPAEAD